MWLHTSWASHPSVFFFTMEELCSFRVLGLITVCVSFACFAHVSVGFCLVLRFPHLFKQHASQGITFSELPQGVSECDGLQWTGIQYIVYSCFATRSASKWIGSHSFFSFFFLFQVWAQRESTGSVAIRLRWRAYSGNSTKVRHYLLFHILFSIEIQISMQIPLKTWNVREQVDRLLVLVLY